MIDLLLGRLMRNVSFPAAKKNGLYSVELPSCHTAKLFSYAAPTPTEILTLGTHGSFTTDSRRARACRRHNQDARMTPDLGRLISVRKTEHSSRCHRLPKRQVANYYEKFREEIWKKEILYRDSIFEPAVCMSAINRSNSTEWRYIKA